MTATTDDLDTAAAVLASVRRDRRLAEDAERRVLQAAAAWAAMHSVDSLADAATMPGLPGSEEEIEISGPGAPLVAEFCVAELAAALGLSTVAGRRYLGHAVELRYRLPLLWRRVVAGELVAWKARAIAERTIALDPAAAEWIDRQLAPFAHKVGPVQLDRLVDEALARFMPKVAEDRRRERAEERRLRIGLDEAGTDGVVHVDGVLDVADALDLEAAVTHTASELAMLGSPESLDVRRSQALGEIARRDLTLDFAAHGEEPGSVVEVRAQRASKPLYQRRASTDRRVVLHVHLTDAALVGRNPVARCDNTDAPVLVDQVREWAGGAATITVRPVIDLAGHAPVDSYEVPDRHREQVRLRDRRCRFPHCRRRAVACDCDHVTRWPDGPTCPCNLAALCRQHHRLKTHGSWTYTGLSPGCYLWRSPHGYHYLVDGTGTEALESADDP